MKKTLILLSILGLFACQKEKRDYVTLSGNIIDRNSDSILIRNRNYSKTIEVNADGSFRDTLRVNPGVYNLFDGEESTYLYLKNGYDIQMSLDTKAFDESLKFKGVGAENNNFLAKKSLMEEKLLDQDKLASLDLEGLNSELDDVKKQLSEFYNSQKDIDTFLINSANSNLMPMLNMYQQYFAGSIALREQLKAGTPSPTFDDYENYDGSKTSLSDFSGKYVYIDVWATWCGPCKAEIPFLKKVEEKYRDKNIQFVSISVDDDGSHGGSWDQAKADWKAMIKNKDMGGVQLFAPNGWQSEFVENYKIQGIPRFILIDPKGNIVNSDAPRPSSIKLLELFDSLSL